MKALEEIRENQIRIDMTLGPVEEAYGILQKFQVSTFCLLAMACYQCIQSGVANGGNCLKYQVLVFCIARRACAADRSASSMLLNTANRLTYPQIGLLVVCYLMLPTDRGAFR